MCSVVVLMCWDIYAFRKVTVKGTICETMETPKTILLCVLLDRLANVCMDTLIDRKQIVI